MGAWGVSLYSSDIAADLRALIDVIVRLPVADQELWQLAVREYEIAASTPDDEDYSTFWMVLAHHLQKKGVNCKHAQEKALSIIDSGVDIEMMRSLDMSESDLARRSKNLQKIRAEIVAGAAVPKKRGPVLKTPQPFIMGIGECFAFPTWQNKSINPYMPRKETYDGKPWVQDGWGAAILLERGYAFEFLAWYRLAALDNAFPNKPDSGQVLKGKIGPGLSAGICTPLQFKKLELERIGSLHVVEGAIHRLVPELAEVASPETQVIRDVSIAGNLETALCAERGFAGIPVATVVSSA